MSCHSCGGCFTGTGCSTAKLSKKEITSDSARFHSLVDLASSLQDEQDKVGHDHVIPTIMSQLSKNVYSSQTVLFKAYDELDLQDFLNLAKELYTNRILGVHIAWAAEYSKMNVKQLLTSLQQGDQLLLQHCDDQAEIHEMFGNLTTGSVGRVQK